MSRALIIACQYKNFPKSQLFGCFNDANALITRLKKIDPFIKITYMRDDLHPLNPFFPDVRNIARELLNLSRCPEKKLYFHYSGHGTTTKDSNNDEKTILKTTNGSQISLLNGTNGDSCMVCYSGRNLVLMRDDDFYFYLWRLRADQTLLAFSDSCNSGTLFDLCYVNVGNYTSEFSTYDISGLLLEINNKCTIVDSYYPDKMNKMKGNILLISGTRDKDYAYEVYADNKPCGIFTYNLCKILDYGVKDMSLRTFYYLIISSINWNQQIPVLTFSQNLNIDNYKMSLLEYKPEKNAPKQPLQVSKVGRAFIAAKANIRKQYKK
jgi:hypothetical protein